MQQSSFYARYSYKLIKIQVAPVFLFVTSSKKLLDIFVSWKVFFFFK